MLIGLALLLCLATVPLARGRLGALADVRFRASITANGGVMPADAEALAAAGVLQRGDVVLVVAALLALHCLCASRLALVRFAVPLAR
jgi:hypothetical protein